MKNNKHTTLTPKEMLTELQELVIGAQGLLVGSVSEHSTGALDNLCERFGAAQERFGAVCDQAKQRVVAGAKCADSTIRQNPYQALAVALGVGLLVGVLATRGRD